MLLEQLADVVGGHVQVLRFAKARETEADLGLANVAGGTEPGDLLTARELDVLIAGFTTIRDQEPLTMAAIGRTPSWPCSNEQARSRPAR